MLTTNEPRRYIKSSRSGGSGGNCVECAHASAGVHLRDSKNVAGPELLVSHHGWTYFLKAVKAGTFDRD